jgi:hypothetical protein
MYPRACYTGGAMTKILTTLLLLAVVSFFGFVHLTRERGALMKHDPLASPFCQQFVSVIDEAGTQISYGSRLKQVLYGCW